MTEIHHFPDVCFTLFSGRNVPAAEKVQTIARPVLAVRSTEHIRTEEHGKFNGVI